MRGFSRPQQGIILCLAAFIALVWFFFHRDDAPDRDGRDIRLTIVEAAGRVRRPGVYFFEAPPTLHDVISAAGGLDTDAPLDASTAPDSFESGRRLNFSQTERGIVEIRMEEMSADKRIPLGIPIDLNRATVEDLELLPSISPTLAAGIVEARDRRGKFHSVEDLEEVKGIGPSTIEKLRPFTEAKP